MAAVELPLSLNSAPNSLYRQSSESMYRPSAADKLFRQKSSALPASSSTSSTTSSASKSTEMLNAVVAESQSRQSASLPTSPFCGLQTSLQHLQTSSNLASTVGLKRNHLAVENSSSASPSSSSPLNQLYIPTTVHAGNAFIHQQQHQQPEPQQPCQPMDFSTVDETDNSSAPLQQHLQQQETLSQRQKTPPPLFPQLAWTTPCPSSSSSYPLSLSSTTCSKASSPTAPSGSGCGSWSSTHGLKVLPRKIRNPKLKLKIAPLRQLSLCQQRMDELSSPSALTPSTPSATLREFPCSDQNNLHLGPICESPQPDIACSRVSFQDQQHQHQQHQQQQQQHHRSPISSNSNSRSRCVGGLQMRTGSPPKTAPPSVAPSPMFFPTSASTTPMSDRIESAVASRVLPNVFLGSASDAADLDYLKTSNITHVLNVSTNIPCFHEATTAADAAAEDAAATSSATTHHSSRSTTPDSSSSSSTSSFSCGDDSWRPKYKRLAASDNLSQNLGQYFDEAFCFIDEALRQRGSVLIHCQAGISRSSTILIAFIMHRSSLSMLQAYKFVKSKRSIISPNLNFMGQLLEFEQTLQRQRKAAAAVDGILEGADAVDGGVGGSRRREEEELGEELVAFVKAAAATSSQGEREDDDEERFDSV